MKTRLLLCIFLVIAVTAQSQYLQWETQFSAQKTNLIGGLSVQADGSSIIVGTYIPGWSGSWGIFRAKYDSNGGVVWSDTNNLNSVDWNSAFCSYNDHLFFSFRCGSTTYINDSLLYYPSTHPDNSALICFDTSGQLTFLKPLLAFTVLSSTATADALYIGGASAAGSVQGVPIPTGATVLKFDHAGNFLSYIHLAPGGWTVSYLDHDADGNLYFVKSNPTSAEYLLKYDSAGVFQWQYPIGGYASSFQVGPGNDLFVSVGGYLKRYDPNHNLIWTTDGMYPFSESHVAFDEHLQQVYEVAYRNDSVKATYLAVRDLLDGSTISAQEIILPPEVGGYWNARVVKQNNDLILAGEYVLDYQKIGINKYSLLAPTTIVEQTREQELVIYPNPSQGDFTVSCSGLQENSWLRIYDSAGKIVCSKSLQASNGVIRERVSMKGVAKGRYQVEVFSGVKRCSQGILIN